MCPCSSQYSDYWLCLLLWSNGTNGHSSLIGNTTKSKWNQNYYTCILHTLVLNLEKPYGGSAKKGKAPSMEMKAQPLAMAVTLPNQAKISQPTSDAIDVDHVGRCPPVKCFICRKLGHTARFCREKRGRSEK